jgi:hypothetical protein
MITKREEEMLSLTDLRGEEIKGANQFRYLGSLIPSENEEIRKRIATAKYVIRKNRKVFKSKKIQIQTKKTLLQVLVVSTLLYNCETWTVTEARMRKLKAAYDWCIKQALNIAGIEWANANRRKSRDSRNSQESLQEGTSQGGNSDSDERQDENEEEESESKEYESYDSFASRNGMKPIAELIRERRTIWLGHVLRGRDRNDTTYNCFERARIMQSGWWTEGISKDLQDLNQSYEKFKEVAKSGAGVKNLLWKYSALNKGTNADNTDDVDGGILPNLNAIMNNMSTRTTYLMSGGWANAKQ